MEWKKKIIKKHISKTKIYQIVLKIKMNKIQGLKKVKVKIKIKRWRITNNITKNYNCLKKLKSLRD